MERRRLGRCGLEVSVVGFGAFKIGRNEGIKYPSGYDLPADEDATRILRSVADLGVTLFDVAPAYGLAEARLGAALADRRDALVWCTKVGETFEEGASRFDFSSGGIRRSLQRSLRRLRTDAVDLLLLHSDGRDEVALATGEAMETLVDLRDAGLCRAIGFSGKTVDGAQAALAWSDAIMVAYHARDTSHDEVMRAAHDAGVGVLVKKGLASGHLPPEEAIPFVLAHPAVSSLVLGGLDLGHLAANVAIARAAARPGD